jgi:hypothetical protein
MQLGDCTTAELIERSPLDAALDTLDAALAEVIEKIDSGQLDQLDNTAKLALWHRFESIRNRLPLVDHGLIADAEATDLAGSYGFSSMSRFLTRILQLSPPGRRRPGSGPPPQWVRAAPSWGRGWSHSCPNWLSRNATVR